MHSSLEKKYFFAILKACQTEKTKRRKPDKSEKG